MRSIVALSSLTALAACGGYTDSGDGSDSLDVDARVSFTAGTALMDARIAVDKKSAFVKGAVVTLTDSDTKETFTLDEDGNFYRTHIAGGYRRKLELEIAHDSDKLSAKLEGPGEQFIVSPIEGTTIDLGSDPVKVEWSTKDGLKAEGVTVTTDNSEYRGETNEDSGKVEIPRELLRSGDDTIHVTRSESVKLEHADNDSSLFEITYEALSRVHFDE